MRARSWGRVKDEGPSSKEKKEKNRNPSYRGIEIIEKRTKNKKYKLAILYHTQKKSIKRFGR